MRVRHEAINIIILRTTNGRPYNGFGLYFRKTRALEKRPYITIGIVAALVLLLLIWIAAIVDKRAKYVTGFFGGIFSFVGAVSFLSGAVIFLGSAIAFTFTHNVGFYLSENLLLPLAVMFGIIGAAEFFIGFIFKKTSRGIKKKERKKAAAATAPAPAPTINNI